MIGTLMLFAFGRAYANDGAPDYSSTGHSSAGYASSYSSSASTYNTANSRLKLALDPAKVYVEADGSFTPKSERSIDILAALNSSVGAAVNIELQFAKNSSVLTADGKQTLSVIADAISYLDSNIEIDLEIPKHRVKGKPFTKARGDELIRLLRSRYGIKNPLKLFITSPVSKASFRSVKAANKTTDLERITVLNMGIAK